MSKLALPLQLLLALALILSGVGGAMAGVLLPALATTADVAVASQVAASGDCHGPDDAAATGGSDTRVPGSGCHSDDDTGCGESAQCLQACLHAWVAVTPLFHVGIQALAADAILHPLASGHPAPPLPSPIRPPIA